ncbi:hypothetical protein MHUMG1_07033 [Metarhizium humberi]|uniref:Uncharacterized protein n=1 Tax=Metarhizium humberi TaxID=2596975 RepID=A0A9P8M7L5_9HYPO|nr:hypothetical protein MHUMG1_07033 [Metarhizium humberi]
MAFLLEKRPGLFSATKTVGIDQPQFVKGTPMGGLDASPCLASNGKDGQMAFMLPGSPILPPCMHAFGGSLVLWNRPGGAIA